MDRNKLVKIIQRDLNELTELTDEMAGKAQIFSLEIDLALGKLRIISQEFEYLKELSLQSSSPAEISESHVSSAPPAETSHERITSARTGNTSPADSAWSPENEPLSGEIQDDTGAPFAEPETENEIEETGEKIAEPVDLAQEDPFSGHNEIGQEEVQEPSPAKKTVAEFFIQERSVNETIADKKKTIDHRLAASPVSKLEAAIGLNDRFQFIRELFNNDAGLFNQTVKQIDQMPDINAAVTYLNSNFKWKKNETSLKFAQLVKRRFSNEGQSSVLP